MKKIACFLIVLVIFICWSCNQQLDEGFSEVSDFSTLDTTAYENGTVRIKMIDGAYERLNVSNKSSGLSTESDEFNQVIREFRVAQMVRVFPPCGKYEKRTRAEGLHLWYDLKYDKKRPLSTVIKSLKAIDQISYVEPVYKVQLHNHTKAQVVDIVKTAIGENDDLPFNDPGLKQQWHYFNDGVTVKDAVKGADINLFPAWEKETGKPEVIVAVVDGGIDVMHEDLAQNVWKSTSESSGSKNIDDDKNGYIDDVNGFNFVTRVGKISPHDHGTHVAGTVAAVNNNGLGVCGVAGGTGSSTSGIRLMSCQVFATDEKGEDISASSFEEAIKYGADNGAVISQNSWGYTEIDYMPASMKAAIDYFIKYAGVDEDGNQVGPVKGGVVIFASGNENRTFSYPAMYEGTVAVASIAPDYVKAYYSNYGDWIDIAAPGGSIPQGSKYSTSCQVLSTLPNNNYGYFQGTSMACPHVSGVAALIASRFGGIGFTSDLLKSRLSQGATDLNYFNSRFVNQLGVGVVNASAALSSIDGIAPEPVVDFDLEVESNVVNVKWKVTSDADDVKAAGYVVYYSNDSFDQVSLYQNSTLNSKVVETGNLSVGDNIEVLLDKLDFSTNYHISIVGFDAMRNYSEMSPVKSIKTTANQAPIISTNSSLNLVLHKFETVTIPFNISDPDGHSFSYSIHDPSGALTAYTSNNAIMVKINALAALQGSYVSKLIAIDIYGAESSVEITFSILPNTPPQIIRTVDNVYIGKYGGQTEINLDQYFTDEDGENLAYVVDFSGKVIHANVNKNILYITAKSSGMSDVSIIAKDNSGEMVTAKFKVVVRDDNQEVDLYPMPVKDVLNIRMGKEVNGSIEITLKSLSGSVMLKKNIEINPFAPGKLDLSDIAGGSYRLMINYEGKELVRNIIKL